MPHGGRADPAVPESGRKLAQDRSGFPLALRGRHVEQILGAVAEPLLRFTIGKNDPWFLGLLHLSEQTRDRRDDAAVVTQLLPRPHGLEVTLPRRPLVLVEVRDAPVALPLRRPARADGHHLGVEPRRPQVLDELLLQLLVHHRFFSGARRRTQRINPSSSRDAWRARFFRCSATATGRMSSFAAAMTCACTS